MTDDTKRAEELKAILDAPANLTREANEYIAIKVKEARAIIKDAEEIADRFNVSFTFSVEYGMGGTYAPAGSDEFVESGWNSSSAQC
jgi:hypothetical protein